MKNPQDALGLSGVPAPPLARSASPGGLPLTLPIPEELVEAIAERAAEIVISQLPAVSAVSEYVTPKEAAARIRAKPQRIYDLLSSGRLTRYKEGRRTLVLRAEVDALVVAEGRSRVAPSLPSTSQRRMNRGLAA